jgi:HSP20 family protein
MSSTTTTNTQDEARSANGHGAKVRAQVTAPPVDVYENDDEFLVTVDVPGARADSVQVELQKDRISITAGTAGDAGAESAARRPRAYHRTFVVPDGIDGAAITAELSQGVLRVRLPKSAARKPRTIPVRSAVS